MEAHATVRRFGATKTPVHDPDLLACLTSWIVGFLVLWFFASDARGLGVQPVIGWYSNET